MPLNTYFTHTIAENEQELHDSLINEAIEIHGVEAYYLPRTTVNVDDIFREEQLARFTQAIPVPLYINTVDSFGGQQEFLSKFGHEVRDRITFSMSRIEFEQTIQPEINAVRPREGDIIYLPMTGGLYEIMFLDQEAQSFYQLGKLHAYELVCELFEYNNEEFDTGIPAVDSIETVYSTNEQNFVILNSEGEAILNSDNEEIFFSTSDNSLSEQDNTQQNEEFGDLSSDIIDFTVANPFSERIT